jgi:tungstate transport system ATP-binding protein
LGLRRRFAVVFQESLLLNATVWDNVTLGLRIRGFMKDETKARTQKWLERFGIASLAKRQAKTLSGGEAKRASLARAFALQPEVLFLDEPFAALDSPTRQALLEDFESVLRETRVTTVMVTHDRNEALVLANRVVVLMNGLIRQIGTPEEVFSSPVDEEVASFVEAGNILHGVVASQNNGLVSVEVGGQQVQAVSNLNVGTRVSVYLHYEDVTISLSVLQTIASSARNQFAGKVVKVFPVGSQMRVTVDCSIPLVALITRRSWEELGLTAGQAVIASFKASSIHLTPRR